MGAPVLWSFLNIVSMFLYPQIIYNGGRLTVYYTTRSYIAPDYYSDHYKNLSIEMEYTTLKTTPTKQVLPDILWFLVMEYRESN